MFGSVFLFEKITRVQSAYWRCKQTHNKPKLTPRKRRKNQRNEVILDVVGLTSGEGKLDWSGTPSQHTSAAQIQIAAQPCNSHFIAAYPSNNHYITAQPCDISSRNSSRDRTLGQ
jgi:hypothetical protein